MKIIITPYQHIYKLEAYVGEEIEVIDTDGSKRTLLLVEAVQDAVVKCQYCYFRNKYCKGILCGEFDRSDETDIYFKEIKVFDKIDLDVGARFYFNEKLLEVAERNSNSCEGCAMSNCRNECKTDSLSCSDMIRRDSKNVCFKEVKND